VSRRSTCCGVDADCAAATCETARCDAGTCVVDPVAGCCDADADCVTSDPCRAARCDRASGECVSDVEPSCCASGADCDDGDGCTLDECAAADRCQARVLCATDGPCGDRIGCVQSALFIRDAPAGEGAVWRLDLANDALVARLRGLSLRVESERELPRGWRFEIRDEAGAVLGVANAATGPVTLPLSLDLEPGARRSIVIATVRAPQTAGVAGLGAVALVGLAALARRRRLLLVAVLWACARTAPLPPVAARLHLDAPGAVSFEQPADEGIDVRGLPLTSPTFTLRW
jgi:hypothetical protein